MDHDGAGGAILDGAQNLQQLVHVVTVNGAEIAKPQLLEQGATDGHMFDHIAGAFRPLAEGFRQQEHGAFGCCF